MISAARIVAQPPRAKLHKSIDLEHSIPSSQLDRRGGAVAISYPGDRGAANPDRDKTLPPGHGRRAT